MAIVHSKATQSQTTLSEEERVGEIQALTKALGAEVSAETLQQVAAVCVATRVADPSTPLSPSGSPTPFSGAESQDDALHSSIWEKDRSFDRLFKALVKALEPTKVSGLAFCSKTLFVNVLVV